MLLLATLPGTAGLALAAVAYLLVKHTVADFLLQTEVQRKTKGIYAALGGITHSLTHVVLTAPVFLLLPGLGVSTMVIALLGEFLVHYHVDWSKEQLIRRNGWTSHDTPFWWALGLDQLCHGLTYVAILWYAFAKLAGTG
jgi:hypothetical protein